MSTKAVPAPVRNPYGALELKQYINKSTIRGFLITTSLLLLFLIFKLISSSTETQTEVQLAPVPITQIDITEPPVDDSDVPPPPPPPPASMVGSGPASRAGNPTPIPDAEIAPDLKEFASFDEMHHASSIGGDGLGEDVFSENIEWGDEQVEVETREAEPEPDEFIPVEKQPGMDLAELQKLVQYPKLAKEAGVEGKVVVKALIDKSGAVKKTLIVDSDNSLLNQAAIDAIKNYKKFTPALQNNAPVMVWVSIPIRFRLR